MLFYQTDVPKSDKTSRLVSPRYDTDFAFAKRRRPAKPAFGSLRLKSSWIKQTTTVRHSSRRPVPSYCQ